MRGHFTEICSVSHMVFLCSSPCLHQYAGFVLAEAVSSSKGKGNQEKLTVFQDIPSWLLDSAELQWTDIQLSHCVWSWPIRNIWSRSILNLKREVVEQFIFCDIHPVHLFIQESFHHLNNVKNHIDLFSEEICDNMWSTVSTVISTFLL